MKKLSKSLQAWLDYETDELILFLHQQGGPDAVKTAIERMQTVFDNNTFKECKDRYLKNRS